MTVIQDNIRLSSDIFFFLQNNSSGEVLLTTSKGIYLQFPSRILLITSQDYGVTPIGIGLSHFVDFLTVIDPKAGQKVAISDGRICFSGGILEAEWDVVTAPAKVIRIIPEQIRCCAQQLLEQCVNSRGVASLAAPLLLDLPLPINARSNPYCSVALRVLNKLVSGKTDNIEEVVRRLLGLGLGLTPSLDDVMLGMLYGWMRFAPNEPRTASLRDAILTNAPICTNSISAAYLIAVAQNGIFELLDNLIDGLSGETPINIAPILQIGSSSGSERLLGLLLAAKMTMKG